jgi:hypothetical protein
LRCWFTHPASVPGHRADVITLLRVSWSWRRCRHHEQHVDGFEPKTGDPLHAVAELCAQRPAGLAGELTLSL